MIVVTSNYRLSGLGFAALPELANVTGNGNFGLLDQRLALQWVQDNIAAFGGDRSRVTIWGQSAGGQSVCFHLASPASAGLFSAAISSSGPCILPYPLVLSAQQEGVKWAGRVGCQSAGSQRLQCLRNASLHSLLAAGAPRSSKWDGFLYPGKRILACTARHNLSIRLLALSWPHVPFLMVLYSPQSPIDRSN